MPSNLHQHGLNYLLAEDNDNILSSVYVQGGGWKTSVFYELMAHVRRKWYKCRTVNPE